MEYYFYLKKQLIDKLLLFINRHLADIFSQMRKMSLSFQEKQLTQFFASDKFWAFK